MNKIRRWWKWQARWQVETLFILAVYFIATAGWVALVLLTVTALLKYIMS